MNARFIILTGLALLSLAILPIQLVYAGDTDPVTTRVPSQECSKELYGKMVNSPGDSDIPHQYMLLLIFKKGTGASYFGHPKNNEYGCVADARAVHGANGIKYERTGTEMLTSGCPNDCQYPRVTHTTAPGTDPLGVTPWGIMAPSDPSKPGGDPASKIEIWQIVARNACHAQALHGLLSATEESNPIAVAVKNGDFIGDIMPGYLDPEHKPGPSKMCE